MAPPASPPLPPASLRPPAPGQALALLGESVAHRTELAALELDEARAHAIVSALLAGAAGALTLFTGVAFTLLVASLVWDDPHRGWWLGGLCAAYLLAAGAAGLTLARRWRAWRPLAESRNQLQQDCQCLGHLIKSIAS